MHFKVENLSILNIFYTIYFENKPFITNGYFKAKNNKTKFSF